MLSYNRYRSNVKARLIKHRNEHLEEINKKSSYKQIQVKDKEPKEGKGDARTNGETDLNSLLKKRLQGIQEEMQSFNTNISEFA